MGTRPPPSGVTLPSSIGRVPASPPFLVVGDRVRVPPRTGTVRYVGPLPGAAAAATAACPPPTDEDTWVGIEWDTPTGKHDGTVGGVRLFTAPPHSASFVRASRLGAGGRTPLWVAVDDRYGAYDDMDGDGRGDGGGGSGGGINSSTTGGSGDGGGGGDGGSWESDSAGAPSLPRVVVGGKVAELVGMDRPRGGAAGTVLGLDGTGVAGGGGEPRRRAMRVVHLDLSGCLLSRASEVVAAVAGMGRLRGLALSRNRLDARTFVDGWATAGAANGGEGAGDGDARGTATVTRLSLWGIPGLGGRGVCAVAAGFPALTDLGAGDTGIMGGAAGWAAAAAVALAGVAVLDLDANALTWEGAVVALGGLPRLRRLVLSNNGIRSLRRGGTADAGGNDSPLAGEPVGRLPLPSAVACGGTSDRPAVAAPHFPVLGYLNLAGNPFGSYDDLEPLADLPALTALVLPPVHGLDPPRPSPVAVAVAGAPAAASATPTATAAAAVAAAAADGADALAAAHTAQLLAVLPRLTTLNGTALSADDRTTAERAYLRATAPLVVAASAAPPPPAFARLAAQYGTDAAALAGTSVSGCCSGSGGGGGGGEGVADAVGDGGARTRRWVRLRLAAAEGGRPRPTRVPAVTTVDELASLHRALTKAAPPLPVGSTRGAPTASAAAAAAAAAALVFVGGGRRVVMADGWRTVGYYVGEEGGGRVAGTVFWGT